MKRVIKAGMSGIVIGLFCSLFFNWLFQSEVYTPGNPYATASVWYSQHLNSVQVMTLSVFYWALIGMMFELGNWFFDRDWSLLKMTVAHYMTMLCGFIPLAALAGWFSWSLANFIMFTFIFTVIYTIIYIASLSRLRKEISSIEIER